MSRPETGPMQFGDDWPGVFIRGDTANWINHLLDGLLDAQDDEVRGYYVTMLQINGARGLLACRAQDDQTQQQLQRMKPIEECKVQV